MSKPVINKSKRNVSLLLKHPLLLTKKPLQLQTKEPKPRGQPYKSIFKRPFIVLNKRSHPKNPIKRNVDKNELAQVVIQTK